MSPNARLLLLCALRAVGAFIVGIPVFFQVGFVLLIPLVFTIARRTGMSLVKIGIPLVAGLSVVHGMVPPHPAAMLAVVAYQADVGRTVAYALLVGLPTAALAGPIFATWIAPRIALPEENPLAAQFVGGVPRAMPGFGISLFTVLLPVILMVCAGAADVALAAAGAVRSGVDVVGVADLALLVVVLATGAGSLVLSHVNDSGFWLIKEFFNMTVQQTLKTWTVAESIIGVAGLGFTLLLSLVVGCAPREQGTGDVGARGWIDVTAMLDPATTPVYAGDAPMKFDFLKDMRKGDVLTLSGYSLGAHSGTHIDAPMHFVANGAPIDQVPLEPLIGTARVIDIPDSVRAIDSGELNRHAWRGAKRVLFRTRSTLRGWMA